jgi:hypothetical protein
MKDFFGALLLTTILSAPIASAIAIWKANPREIAFYGLGFISGLMLMFLGSFVIKKKNN